MDDTGRAPVGRPRGFDTDEALEQAMVLFWERGYDAVSLTDLARIMGITKTSLYAAFGNKDGVFRRTLERYAEGPGSYPARALREPTARRVAEAYLAGAIGGATQPDRPVGCLGVQAFMARGHVEKDIRDALDAFRADTHVMLRDRFQRAVDEGDLPPDADPAVLARCVVATGDGLVMQAVTGVPREELQRVADAAVRGWPTG